MARRSSGINKIALDIDDRPFDDFYFNDKTTDNVTTLQKIVATRHPDRSVNYHSEPAESFYFRDEVSKLCPLLKKSVRPDVRGVVFLDPFATQVSWVSVEANIIQNNLPTLLTEVTNLLEQL